MEDISPSDSINKFIRNVLLATAVLTALYLFTGSDWLAVILVPLAIFLIYSDWSGRVIVGAASVMSAHASEQALGDWQGNYYSWNNQQIRVLDGGNAVWVVDVDLIRAAGLKLDSDLRRKLEISYPGYKNIPGTKLKGFDENAVLKFLNGKQLNNPEIIKLKLWFERDVFLPIRKKKEMNNK